MRIAIIAVLACLATHTPAGRPSYGPSLVPVNCVRDTTQSPYATSC